MRFFLVWGKKGTAPGLVLLRGRRLAPLGLLLLSPGERRNVSSVGLGSLPLPRLSNSVALPGLVRARSLRTLRRLLPAGAPHLRDCAGALDARSRVAAPSGTYLPWTTCPRRGRWRGSNSSVGSGFPQNITFTLSTKRFICSKCDDIHNNITYTPTAF